MFVKMVSSKCSRATGNSFAGRMFVTSGVSSYTSYHTWHSIEIKECVVHLKPLHFLWNFDGNGQKWHGSESGIVTRFDCISN